MASEHELEMVVAVMKRELQDFKEYIDRKFNDLKIQEERSDKIFNDLYCKIGSNSNKLARHSAYIAIGTGIIASLWYIVVSKIYGG